MSEKLSDDSVVVVNLLTFLVLMATQFQTRILDPSHNESKNGFGILSL